MQPTIEKAVEAHKAGKLEEAEALYRAILEDQPQHPDANHNLGVLAVSVNQLAAALPLLKTALEANPKQGQYWISYVDALIRNHQPETARVVLEQGKEMGLAGEQVDTLSQQLASRSAEPETGGCQRRSPKRTSPSQIEVNLLMKHYESMLYVEAERLAVVMTQEHPNHEFGWKALGAVLAALGKRDEAVIANQRAVALAPTDAEAHSNLGATLKELGRLEDAEASHRQAIAIKPEYAPAYNNLGITLQELGKLKDAEASYRTAIVLQPDYLEAYYNRGVILQELGRLGEAESSYRQAVALKPDYAEAHSNLGQTLQDLGRMEDAEVSYQKAVALKPGLTEAHNNLGVALLELGRPEDAAASLRHAISLKPDFAEAHANLGRALKDLGRIDDAETSYRQALAINPHGFGGQAGLGTIEISRGRHAEGLSKLRGAYGSIIFSTSNGWSIK